MGKLVDFSYRKIQWIVRDTANSQPSTVDSCGIVGTGLESKLRTLYNLATFQ